LDRDEGGTNTEDEKDESERILEEKRDGRGIENDGDNNAACEHAKLFDGHVTDQTEAVATDVLW